MVFDFEVALRGMGDDRTLLHETLQDFVDYYGDAGEKIRAAIAESRHHDAEILAHTLKGLGGTFAAKELSSSALALERSLHANELDGLEQMVSDLNRIIGLMIADITSVLKS